MRVQYQPIAEPFSPPASEVTPLSWSPEYPDFAKGPRPLFQQGYLAEVPPAVPFHWNPGLRIDWIAAKPYRAHLIPTLFWTSLGGGPNPHLGGGRTDSPYNRRFQYQSIAEPIFNIPIVNPTGVDAWASQHPDVFLRPPRRDYLTPTLFEPVLPPAGPGISWQSEYPDLAPGPRRPVPQGWLAEPPLTIPNTDAITVPADVEVFWPTPFQYQAIAKPPFVPAIVPAPVVFGWLPIYPSFAPGRLRQPNAVGVSVEPLTRPSLAGPLTWLPNYPSLLRRVRPTLVPGGTMTVGAIVPPPPPPTHGGHVIVVGHQPAREHHHYRDARKRS